MSVLTNIAGGESPEPSTNDPLPCGELSGRISSVMRREGHCAMETLWLPNIRSAPLNVSFLSDSTVKVNTWSAGMFYEILRLANKILVMRIDVTHR